MQITGCDTTSYISGHTKLTAWKVLMGNSYLLEGFGDVENENTYFNAEPRLPSVWC